VKRAFTHAHVLDVLERKILNDCTVLVEDGIITAVGADADTAGAQIVDLGGKYLTPGLFNSHIHMTFVPALDLSLAGGSTVAQTLNALDNLAMHIKSGVTFIRDAGAQGNIGVELRNAARAGKLRMVPDMQVSGKAITMTGGTAWNIIGYEADGEDECRKAARLMIRDGVDWLKLMATGGVLTHGVEPGCTQLSEAELHAAVEEGHKVGIKSMCHAQGNEGIKNAIRAGVDSIEHGFFLDDEAIQMMLDRGTWLCATLTPVHVILENADKGIPEEFVRKARYAYEHHLDSFKRAHAAGVPCALGTDAGCTFNPHDLTYLEMALMVQKCGIDAFEALAMGTINSARLCGVEDSLGSVTVGKKAHLAVFEKNPIQDISATKDCAMTVKNGEILWAK